MTDSEKYSRKVLRHPGRFMWRVLKGFKRNQGLLLSGGVAYNSLLSIIPMLALILIGLSQFIEQEKLLEIIIKELELIVPGHAEQIADEVAVLCCFSVPWPLPCWKTPWRSSFTTASKPTGAIF
jgi:uncharacterized BrkB/YihY/UPF0761 family membrane protein